MKVLLVLFALCMSAALVSGQFFDGFDRRLALNDIFGGGIRDSRQDRGPVVFPPPPRGGPVESSGVVVGASGFGFVPPSQNQFFETPSQRSLDFYNSRYFRYF